MKTLFSLHGTAERVRAFLVRENVTWSLLLSPTRIYSLLLRYRFLHFFVVGSSGVTINLGVTWGLTTFVFGLPNYFFAYLFGIAANLLFNFTLYTITIFQTRANHLRRLMVFVTYSLIMAYVQATVVRFATPIVGLQYYLFVIAATILFFSFVNFLVFKLSIFKEN